MSPLVPRVVGSDSSESSDGIEGIAPEQGKKIGMILAGVVVAVATGFALFVFWVRRRRRLQAARGTRLRDPVYDVSSAELVPWLTRGSDSPSSTNLATYSDPVVPPNAGFAHATSTLPPSPNYSRLPPSGHQSANPSIESVPEMSLSGDGVSERLTGTGGDGTLSLTGNDLPPPYSSGASAVGDSAASSER